jgi:hypothetical protein
MALGVVVVALALAGCSLLPGSTTTPKAAIGVTPLAGQCWNASVKQASSWSPWKGTRSVSCATSHTLYTYQVGRISGEPGSSWATASEPDSLTPAIQTKADDACHVSTLLPALKWNQQLISEYFFVPTEAQWKAGARWVRCDIGVLAIGTTLDDERFTALPSKIATLVNEVSSNPLKFEFCVDSSTPVSEAGPLDNPDATVADCNAGPQWRLTIHGQFPDAAGAPFPDQATSNAASSKLCLPQVKNAGEIWIAYLPTKAAWASGDREIDCWVGEKSIGGGSAGTA